MVKNTQSIEGKNPIFVKPFHILTDSSHTCINMQPSCDSHGHEKMVCGSDYEVKIKIENTKVKNFKDFLIPPPKKKTSTELLFAIKLFFFSNIHV